MDFGSGLTPRSTTRISGGAETMGGRGDLGLVALSVGA